jgi:hypothetical protein
MKETPVDAHMREALHLLRDEVAAAVPPFSIAAELRVRRRWPRWALAAAGAAVAALVLWLIAPWQDRGSAFALDLSATTWVAPSDFLLETPGRDLLRSLPEIDIAEYVPQLITPDRGTADTSD